MNFPKQLIAILALLPGLALANTGGHPLDKAPERASMASLQNGAKLFVNHCLNCHSAVSMRYNRLKDLGLTDEQIKGNLLFGASFLTLGYLGTQLPTDNKTLIAQVCTLLYFSFFLLMPWWSSMGTFKPVPKRVTFHPH